MELNKTLISVFFYSVNSLYPKERRMKVGGGGGGGGGGEQARGVDTKCCVVFNENENTQLCFCK